ncbi:MAG: YjbQ family protein [Candidatus Stahlbacteria bacterium]|nr:YjbQ family protein [Candidatus Stahlbacteria bacterium]
METLFIIDTVSHKELIDITYQVEDIIHKSNIKAGFCIVYIPHATAGIILNESADPNIKTDFLNAINKAIPEHNNYLHDRIDNNAAAHIKSALCGSSATIPISNGKLELGTWQSIMLCEFDGPRTRKIIVQVYQSNV